MGLPQANDLFKVNVGGTQGVAGTGTNYSVKWSEMLAAIAALHYTQAQVDDLVMAKANVADVYTIGQVDTALALKANVADVYTSTAVDTALALKANQATTYTKAEVDAAFDSLINGASAAMDTLSELSAALGDDPNFATTIATQIAGKADIATSLAGYGIVNAYTITETDNAITAAITALALGTAAQANTGDFATAAQGVLADNALPAGNFNKANVDALGINATHLGGQLPAHYLAYGNLTGVPATFAPSAHVHAAGDVTTGTFGDARIAETNVTQHQAALSIGWSQLTSIPTDVSNITALLGAKAPLASPALTGIPTAPTAAPDTNSTQIATTAYVDEAVTAAGGYNSTAFAADLATKDTDDLTEGVANLYYTNARVGAYVTKAFVDALGINATQLGGQAGSYYLAYGNLTGVPSTFAPSAHTHAIADVTGLQTALDGKVASSLLGAAGGVATLDGSGLVPASQLPSFVDDVIEAANYAALPGSGETGKIYITLDDSKTYRWTGSVYAEIIASPGTTDNVTEGATNLYYTNARVASYVTKAYIDALSINAAQLGGHAIGTSGASIPLLNVNNTWSGLQTFTASGGSGVKVSGTAPIITLEETDTANSNYIVSDGGNLSLRLGSLADNSLAITSTAIAMAKSNLTLTGSNPAVLLTDTATADRLRIINTGSNSYIQAESALRFTGYLGADLPSFQVKTGGVYRDIYHSGNFGKVAIDALGVDAATLDGLDSTAFGKLSGGNIWTNHQYFYNYVIAGYGSGGVAMTHNDGYGNANLTFNHVGGTPEQSGNAGRIQVNTDASTGAAMSFQVKSGVVSGVAGGLTETLNLYETYATLFGNTVWHAGNFGKTQIDALGVDAASVAGYVPTAYNTFTGNAIVTRHSSGYIYSNYFNMTASQETAVPSRVAIETATSGFLRWQTLAQFITNLQANGVNDGGNAATLSGESLVDNASTGSTVAGRNGSGDIFARLIRQTYADQATISGGMVFRTNNSTDNYLRVCNNVAAIRTYLGLGTAATANTSTSGANVPLMNGANVWSNHQRYNDNIYQRFGSGNDIDMFWNGTHLYMDFQTANNSFLIRNVANANVFQFNVGTGEGTATGDWTKSSDRRMKDEIETVEACKIFDMRGVRYRMKDTGVRSAGIIAQELQRVAPELVRQDGRKMRRVVYDGLHAYTIEGLKALRDENKSLRKELNSLRRDVDKLLKAA